MSVNTNPTTASSPATAALTPALKPSPSFGPCPTKPVNQPAVCSVLWMLSDQPTDSIKANANSSPTFASTTLPLPTSSSSSSSSDSPTSPPFKATSFPSPENGIGSFPGELDEEKFIRNQAALILMAMARSGSSPIPQGTLFLDDLADEDAPRPAKRPCLKLRMNPPVTAGTPTGAKGRAGPVRGGTPAGARRRAGPGSKPKKTSPLGRGVKQEGEKGHEEQKEKEEKKEEEEKVVVSRSGRAIRKPRGFS